MTFKTFSLVLGTTLLAGTLACSSPQPETEYATVAPTGSLEEVPTGSIRNVHKLGDVWFAGQPSAEDFQLLRSEGVESVINLRHDGEDPDLDEAEIVQSLGMDYSHIPFAGTDELTDEVFDAVREGLKSAKRPLIFHCASANRVGATWLPYRVLDQGISFAEALLEAQEIGLRSPGYEERARQYIEAHQNQ